MPVVPAALAEIQDRLEEIRHRLNRKTLTALLCPLLGVLLVLAAVLAWSAMRATPESFRLALYASAGAALLLIIRTVLTLLARWVSLADAARIADDRGHLKERLSTLLWLGGCRSPSPLAPVLVADAFDRRDAWQPRSIVPRRLPFELGFPLAGAALLAAVILFGQPPVTPLAEQLAAMPPEDRQMEMIVPRPPPPPPPPGEAGDEALLEAYPAFGDSDGEGGGHGAGEARTGELTERMQTAIRKALQRFEQTDRPRDLAEGGGARGDLPRPHANAGGDAGIPSAGQGSGDSAPAKPRASGEGDLEPAAERKSSSSRRGANDATENIGARQAPPQGRNDRPRDPKRAGEADAYQPEPRDGQIASMPGLDDPPEITHDGKGTGGRELDEDSDRRPADRNPEQKPSKAGPNAPAAAAEVGGADGTQRGGAQPVSGPGENVEGLFAETPPEGMQPGQVPPAGTFKLTLGSFLVSAPGDPSKPGGMERVTAPSGRAAVTEPPALHPDQTADDALRRADVPPEYEEIVRRIFSSRPAR